MNTTQLVAEVSAETGLTRSQVKSVLESMEGVVIKAVKKGEPVTLSGFLSFKQKTQAARKAGMYMNPFTKEEEHRDKRPAKKSVRVGALKRFKDGVA